jgi:nuclear pore complex protein Nup205
MTRGISPAEVYGLVSVLRLITSVCAHSEMARIAIAENPSWQPVLVLVGLLSCSVPAVLKSEILKCLAALAKTPDIGQVIWLSLESAQLIAQVSVFIYCLKIYFSSILIPNIFVLYFPSSVLIGETLDY